MQGLKRKSGQNWYMGEKGHMENKPNWQIVIEPNGAGFVVDVAVFDKSARKQTERILDALEPILAAPKK
jgi:hypothetical protein